MPNYDYDCAACGTRFEIVHGVHAEPPTACPVCGGGPIKKAFTPPTIHFKGSGWAKKERRASPAGSPKSSAPEGASGDASGPGSSEASTTAPADAASPAATTTASGTTSD